MAVLVVPFCSRVMISCWSEVMEGQELRVRSLCQSELSSTVWPEVSFRA